MATAMKVADRADIPAEQTWNREAVFASIDAWQAEFTALEPEVDGLTQYTGKLNDPEILKEAFEAISNTQRRVMTLYFYAAMESSVDSGNNAIKPLLGQISGLAGKLETNTAYVEPELLAIGDPLLTWADQYDFLAEQKFYFEDLLRRKPHVRSAEVEEVLGMASDAFGTMRRTAGELTGTDMEFADAAGSDGDPFEVTQSSIETSKEHPDRELRRSAWNNYADSYLSMKNTLANAYIGSVKHNVFNAQVRGYDSVLESQLAPHNIPLEVFHNLIDTFRENIGTWHRYWEVKRKALGVEQIHPYDIWAPLVENDPQLTYEQAVDFVADGMKPLGDDYVEILRKGCLEERWVDYAVNKGKRQGAFSFGSYDTAPYIMMSFNNNLKAMSTLAHELGHSMHSYYSRKTQPAQYARYSMFVAEVASNFNQALTRAKLFETQDDREFQIALIEEAMGNFHRYFFIMPTLARFEFEVHSRAEKGQPLSADILNGIMSEFYAEGYGETMSDDAERTGITWAQFGHLYVPYYTFQYSTGISAAHALADDILAGDETAPPELP